MEPIDLPDNHKRVLSGTIYMVEKLINELESELKTSGESALSKRVGQLNVNYKHHCLAVIEEFRALIGNLGKKYDLTQETINSQQIINAKKAVMWEILHETTSRHLKKYGELPDPMGKELDNDISILLDLVDKF